MSDYAFIDLHMHTKYSHEELCDESPAHIFGKVQAYVEKFNRENGCNKSCLISFTDHNSIFANVKARELIKSGKYPNVEFVTGCEFTTDLCEMQKLGNKRFTRCHILGYNFDETNPELLAYSRLTHLTFGSDNIGQQICAARRNVGEWLNVNIPFTTLLPLSKLRSDADFTKEFYVLVKEYLQKNQIKFDVSELRKKINYYIKYVIDPFSKNKTSVIYNKDASSMARLKLSEVVRLVKGAGGEVVLAHPGIIKISTPKPEKEKKAGRDVKGFTVLYNLPSASKILEEFIDMYQSVSGTKLDGMENYHSSNFMNKFYSKIQGICESRGLFETCGSDYHGENFVTHRTIGSPFPVNVQRYYAKKYLNADADRKDLYLRIADISAVDQFKGKTFSAKKVAKMINSKNEIVARSVFEDSVTAFDNYVMKDMDNSRSKQPCNKDERYYSNKRLFDSELSILQNLQQMFNGLLGGLRKNQINPNFLLAMDKFSRSAYPKIKDMQEFVRANPEQLSQDELKDLIKIFESLHKTNGEILSLKPGLYGYLKNLKFKKFKTRDTYLDKIADITIKKDLDKNA